MPSARETFGLLLASVYSAADPGVTFMEEVATNSSGERLFFAVDHLGNRHVLAPITDDFAYQEHKGSQIELTEWRHPHDGTRFLDLVCRAEQLSYVFALMADSVQERIAVHDEASPLAIQQALHDWKELLRPARQLSREEALGLFGELTVLALLAEHNPAYAVECWTGSDKSRHDFTTLNGDLEVKTTTKEALEVTISSLSQLDSIEGAPLTLVRVHVIESPNGQNLEELVHQLATLGCPLGEIKSRLGKADFRIGVDGDKYRFSLASSPLWWSVTDSFPGLRKSDIPEGRRDAITRLSYTLSLLDAPGRLESTQVDDLLDDLMKL